MLSNLSVISISILFFPLTKQKIRQKKNNAIHSRNLWNLCYKVRKNRKYFWEQLVLILNIWVYLESTVHTLAPTNLTPFNLEQYCTKVGEVMPGNWLHKCAILYRNELCMTRLLYDDCTTFKLLPWNPLFGGYTVPIFSL